MNQASSGSGPGERSADGCSVELYRRLPYFDDLAPIQALLRPHSALLELGCGAGRLTRVLLASGLRVTAVDSSLAMLSALPPEARAVHSEIESLTLPERFDSALLASCLINHPEPHTRAAFVRTCRCHLRQGGSVFIERHDPQWLLHAEVGPLQPRGALQQSLDRVHRTGTNISMTLRYTIAGDTWLHSFAVAALSESEVVQCLAQFGFRGCSWHGTGNRWVHAKVGH